LDAPEQGNAEAVHGIDQDPATERFGQVHHPLPQGAGHGTGDRPVRLTGGRVVTVGVDGWGSSSDADRRYVSSMRLMGSVGP
jgi:hypothetical protein